MVTMNVFTAPDQNRTELKLYQENCEIPIDVDKGENGALIILSSIVDTGDDVNGYDTQEITVEINSTILPNHPIWIQGHTPATGSAIICARTNLFHPGIDGVDTADDIMVSFKEVEFKIDVDLMNNIYEISEVADALDIESSGTKTIRDEYKVEACFCTSGFSCDNSNPILEQNGEVGVCIYPTSFDTKIHQFTLNMDQERNTSPILPIQSVKNNGLGEMSTGVLTKITSDGDRKKVTAMVLGVFFDNFNLEGDPPLDIKFNGTVDLEFKTAASRRNLKTIPIDTSRLRIAKDSKDHSLNLATTSDLAKQAEFSLSAHIIRGSDAGFLGGDDFSTTTLTHDEHQDEYYQQNSVSAGGITPSVMSALTALFAYLAI